MKAVIAYRVAGLLVTLAVLAFGVVKIGIGVDELFGEHERQTITLPATGCDPVTGGPSQFSTATANCPTPGFTSPSRLSTP